MDPTLGTEDDHGGRAATRRECGVPTDRRCVAPRSEGARRGLTYEALGEKLGVSSRTVKRIIRVATDYSVAKLAEVCEVVGIKFFDLMQLAHEESFETFELSEAQEEFLAASPRHFRFFRELVFGLSPDGIREKPARRPEPWPTMRASSSRSDFWNACPRAR